MKIVISSGHGKYIRGASGSPVPPQLDEVDEARRVVDRVAELLSDLEVEVEVFHDDVSTNQSDNLERIVNFHNAQGPHDLDVSVHFNAYDGSAHGCEVLYVTQESLASDMSNAISGAGNFTDRGPKYRSDLYFLNNTREPAILIETCFCDNTSDSDKYHESFEDICRAIAETISGEEIGDRPEWTPPEIPERPPLTEENRVDILSRIRGEVTIIVNGQHISGPARCPHAVILEITMTGDVVLGINGQDFHPPPDEGERPPPDQERPPPPDQERPLARFEGKCSWFGGPNDTGVDADEGLAFIYSYDQAPHLFLREQPSGTTGLARRLNPDVFYVACRWDYNVTPKEMLDDKDKMALVSSPRTGKKFLAWAADWGPHEDTGRSADVSQGLLEALGIQTDDDVVVVYPGEAS